MKFKIGDIVKYTPDQRLYLIKELNLCLYNGTLAVCKSIVLSKLYNSIQVKIENLELIQRSKP